MATGDNVLTAISVGKGCGIVNENSQVYIVDLIKDDNGYDKVIWYNTNNENQVREEENFNNLK